MSYIKEISHCSDLFTGCGFQPQHRPTSTTCWLVYERHT